jgi:hypothetical protein
MFRDGKYYCEYCGKEVTNRHPYYLRRAKHHYCNKEHFYLNKKGNEYILHDDYAEIVIKSETFGTMSGLIDLEDVEKCKKFTWSLAHPKNRYYVVTDRKGEKLGLHRYVMDCPDDMIIDHKNNNGLDNRKSNLQIVTYKENAENRSLSCLNTSGVTGVSWCERDKVWTTQITINGKKKNCGSFKNIKDAEKHVLEMRNKYYTNNLMDRGLREK